VPYDTDKITAIINRQQYIYILQSIYKHFPSSSSSSSVCVCVCGALRTNAVVMLVYIL